MLYSVFVHERVVTEYIIEAESEQEARQKAARGLYVDFNPGETIETLGNPEDWNVDSEINNP